MLQVGHEESLCTNLRGSIRDGLVLFRVAYSRLATILFFCLAFICSAHLLVAQFGIIMYFVYKPV